MLKNYLKIAWRNLMKNKVFSFINIFGLAIGLTCCMLIALYIKYEYSYDSDQVNADRLYQVGTTFVKGEKNEKAANTPAPMASLLKQEFPEIEASALMLGLFADDKTLLRYSENNTGTPKAFYEENGFLADSGFFRMFSYKFIEGNPGQALLKPNSLVLSKEIATKIFGNQSALNKVVHVSSNTNGEYDFIVTGVYEPSAVPSHINARFFLSLQGGDIEKYVKQAGTNLAFNNMFYTYILLRPGAGPKQLLAKFPAFIDKYAGKDLREAGFYKKQFLTNVRDIHLSSDIVRNVTNPGSRSTIYVMASIALFTLLIACINFMNLSTARSSRRSSEVGIRKVLGAVRSSLVGQFLGESFLMSVIAFMIAFVLMFLLLPVFNHISGKMISISLAQDGWILAGFVALSFLTGLMAGSYPAFYLSSFIPIKVLKGRFSNSLAAVSLRKGLVIFQFVISVILIVASVVIAGQMHYIRSTDLGFSKDQQMVVPMRSLIAKKTYAAMKVEASRDSRVLSIGGANYYPGIMNPSDQGMHRAGQSMNEGPIVRNNQVDETYLQTIGVHLLAGRLFSKEFPADTSNRIIINETAMKRFGFRSPQEAIGKPVFTEFQGKSFPVDIIGVVKDFHFQDLHAEIEPYGFYLSSQPVFNYMIIHTKAGEAQGLQSSLANIWRRLNPNEPFEYSYLDENFQKNYEADIRLSSIVGYFTFIAILISCLGLFGLATFSAEQRTKEIGVRKVLGASTGSIVTLLSRDFLKLVAVAIIIGSPLAWYAMNKWLQDFAYRIHINWLVFFITAVAALSIAMATISFQAIRAALSNPVKSLRTE